MALREKIILIYPQLTNADFDLWKGTIMLQNDSDGKGDYIKEWDHSTLAKPTEEQLGASL